MYIVALCEHALKGGGEGGRENRGGTGIYNVMLRSENSVTDLAISDCKPLQLPLFSPLLSLHRSACHM